MGLRPAKFHEKLVLQDWWAGPPGPPPTPPSACWRPARCCCLGGGGGTRRPARTRGSAPPSPRGCGFSTLSRVTMSNAVSSAVSDNVGSLLLAWYARGHRDLPWRHARDPYPIWVSEIMLQQTRAQAVIPYYRRFLERFPTVRTLAAASEDDVLALWSGLGYYSRARNLRRAAQQIAAAGGFPREYAAIRALPGIGDYTAAAVGSIAFDLPVAVVDGNVLRVVARVTNDAGDISAGRTRARFREIAQQWLDPGEPGQFNEALMELGATVCLPRNPLCLVCPLAACCRARQEGTVAQLPVKLRKTAPVRLCGTG